MPTSVCFKQAKFFESCAHPVDSPSIQEQNICSVSHQTSFYPYDILTRPEAMTEKNEGIKEVFWPPTGYLFKEIALSPVFCKPKLIPLKSVTLEKLEKMQADALEKLKEMEEQQQKQDKADQQQQESAEASGEQGQADIWRADQTTPR
ncbi:BBSome-interacting protein 1 [Aphelenchoides bicaudatus]|nr:BBSome-interacting protein 1 [Aphelenchoides bicaudatus]